MFIGSSDLSADMGYTGNAGAPEVVAAIKHAVARIRAAGKAAGIIGGGDFAAMRDIGVTFLGLSADVTVIADALRGLATETREKLGMGSG